MALAIIPGRVFGQLDKTVVGTSFGYLMPDKEVTYEDHTFESESRWERKYGLRIGLYAQWYVSGHLAMQIEIDYQKAKLYQEAKFYEYPQNNYSAKSDVSTASYYFNVIYAITKWNQHKFTPWVFAGVGAKFSPFAVTSKIGGGISYSLLPNMNVLADFYLGPDTLVYADSSVFRLFPFDVKYVALNIGVEFIF